VTSCACVLRITWLVGFLYKATSPAAVQAVQYCIFSCFHGSVWTGSIL